MTRATEARRRGDYEGLAVAFPPGHPLVPSWTAYETKADAKRRVPTTDPARATWYELSMSVRSFDGPGTLRDRWTATFDLTSPNYPYVQPGVRVEPRPWHPHFDQAGYMCVGRVYSKSMGLPELVVATLRMLNWDGHVDTDMVHGGHLQPDAILHWRQHYGKPLSPLTYPSAGAHVAPKFGAPVRR